MPAKRRESNLQTRRRLWPLFERHVADLVEKVGTVPASALVEWSSILLRCSPRTLRNYLNALCSSAGPYEYAPGPGGRIVRYKAVLDAR